MESESISSFIEAGAAAGTNLGKSIACREGTT